MPEMEKNLQAKTRPAGNWKHCSRLPNEMVFTRIGPKGPGKRYSRRCWPSAAIAVQKALDSLARQDPACEGARYLGGKLKPDLWRWVTAILTPHRHPRRANTVTEMSKAPAR